MMGQLRNRLINGKKLYVFDRDETLATIGIDREKDESLLHPDRIIPIMQVISDQHVWMLLTAGMNTYNDDPIFAELKQYNVDTAEELYGKKGIRTPWDLFMEYYASKYEFDPKTRMPKKPDEAEEVSIVNELFRSACDVHTTRAAIDLLADPEKIDAAKKDAEKAKIIFEEKKTYI